MSSRTLLDRVKCLTLSTVYTRYNVLDYNVPLGITYHSDRFRQKAHAKKYSGYNSVSYYVF